MNKKKALKTYTKVFFSVLSILLIILAGVVCGVVYGIVRQADDFDFNNLSMNFTSLIYYTDEESWDQNPYPDR